MARGAEPSRDRAGIGDVELEGCAGRERLGEGDGRLVQLAGVVDVGVERGDGERRIRPCDANALPVERGGDLQRNAREGGFAVVAHGDEGADGDLLLGRARCTSRSKAVKVTAWRSASVAVGALTSCAGRGGGGAGGGGGLAGFVGGAGEDDLAGVGVWRRGCGVVWDEAGMRAKIENGAGERAVRGGQSSVSLKGEAASSWFVGTLGPVSRSKAANGGMLASLNADETELHEPRPFCFFGLAQHCVRQAFGRDLLPSLRRGAGGRLRIGPRLRRRRR